MKYHQTNILEDANKVLATIFTITITETNELVDATATVILDILRHKIKKKKL